MVSDGFRCSCSYLLDTAPETALEDAAIVLLSAASTASMTLSVSHGKATNVKALHTTARSDRPEVFAGHSLMASNVARMTSPGAVESTAFPWLERSSGAAMDPVTEMTVSSIDLLIFSDISDSSLTLSNQDRRAGTASHSSQPPVQYNYTSSNTHNQERDADATTSELPLEALADSSTLHSCLVAPVSSTGVIESFARAAGSLRTDQIGSPLNLKEVDSEQWTCGMTDRSDQCYISTWLA